LWAAELCTSLVLELAEAINDHLLDDLGLEEFVGLIGSIAGDPHRNYLSIRANPLKKKYFEQMQQVVNRVAQLYRRDLSTVEVIVQPDAATTVVTWLESESWPDFTGYLRLGGVAEGDAARLISQTADHLHQISRLKETHPELALRAEEGRRLLLRPPVADTYEGLMASQVMTQNRPVG
ncbi:MAG: hypothetical protein GX589_03625, partial [Deltaproteobacteria bacterium]|nr:hypothetical protein [Deltaproteobacteria bacterium]